MTKQAKSPRYAEISERLRKDIAAGRFPVGTFLPTEATLCDRFGVSRFTVREALRRLQSDGMVSRVQGAGTRVLRETPSGAFVQNYRSMSDLAQFAEETRLEVLDSREVLLDAAMAGQIVSTPGETWQAIRGVRRTTQNEPLALVESYVPKRFADRALELAQENGPIYAGLAMAAGEPIVDAVQETQALSAPSDVAQVLGMEAGAPTLRILRRYSSASGTLIASFNWHLGGERYVQRSRIRLEDD